jgi:hypothetical protein
LKTAQDALVDIQSAIAAKAVIVSEISNKILRAEAEIANLNGLTTAADNAGTGVLDKEDIAKAQAFSDYELGAFAAATTEKSEADEAVAESSGALWTARDTA